MGFGIFLIPLWLISTVSIYGDANFVVISKSEHTLCVYDSKKMLLKEYKVATGLNLKPKTKSGDRCTPEGEYAVVHIYGPDSKKVKLNNAHYLGGPLHKKYRSDEDLGYNAYGPYMMRLNYPNQKDAERGFESGLISKLEYERIVVVGNRHACSLPPQKTKLGGGIYIHGTSDPNSIGHSSSNGCIRMFNHELEEFVKYIRVGTKIFIKGGLK